MGQDYCSPKITSVSPEDQRRSCTFPWDEPLIELYSVSSFNFPLSPENNTENRGPDCSVSISIIKTPFSNSIHNTQKCTENV